MQYTRNAVAPAFDTSHRVFGAALAAESLFPPSTSLSNKKDENAYDSIVQDYSDLNHNSDVGVYFARTPNGVLIVDKILPEGPARKYIGAIQPGDALVAIDSASMIGASPEEAQALLSGVPGSAVSLHLRRKVSGTPFQVTLVRGGSPREFFGARTEFNDSFQHNIGVVPGMDTTLRPWRTPYGAQQRWSLEYDHPNSSWGSSLLYGSFRPENTSPPPNLGPIHRIGAPFATAHSDQQRSYYNNSPPPPPAPSFSSTPSYPPISLASSAQWQYHRIIAASSAAGEDARADATNSLLLKRPVSHFHNVSRVF